MRSTCNLDIIKLKSLIVCLNSLISATAGWKALGLFPQLNACENDGK